MRRALIVWGGWDGHEPKQVAAHFADILKSEGFEVEVSDTLDSVLDEAKMKGLSLFVPVITMSSITGDQLNAVTKAVREEGVGIAGCHGGMCDSFREATEWQFMTGGQWVSHPGNDGVTYTVNVNSGHPITEGIKDFQVVSEQYYLHTDPGNLVLATTQFPAPGIDGPHVGNPCAMPTVWVKSYGSGKVFYNALGHVRKVFDIPEATELMRRGFLWAAK